MASLCDPALALVAADDECAQAATFVEELGLDEKEDPPTARGDDGTMVSILRHPLLQLPWVRNRGVADGTLDGEQSASCVSKLMKAAYELTGTLRIERSKWILNEFRLQCDAGTYAGAAVRCCSAAVLQRAHHSLEARSADSFHPLTTGETLYLPATYTLLAHLLTTDRHCSALACQRVCELGAGLGLLSAALVRMTPPPRQLVVTDGDEAIFPLLCTNIEANRPDSVDIEVMRLRWGHDVPAHLAARFDLFVCADGIFAAEPPSARGSSRVGLGVETESQIRNLLATAAALLCPGGRMVLTAEPRDRLKPPSADPIRRLASVAEATAGLHLVEWRERRLTGEQRPEWETDLLEFEKG